MTVLKDQDQFIKLPVGEYFMMPLWMYVNSDKIPPIQIHKKTRTPTPEEIAAPSPINDVSVAIGIWRPKSQKNQPIP